MSNGLGAGFGSLLLLAVLVIVAGALALTTATAFALSRRGGAVPRAVQYAAVGLLGLVVAVGGFAVLALYDEAWRAAVLFAAIVWAPLVLVAARARWSGIGWLGVAATSGMAWSVPFLVGVGVLFALTTSTDLSTWTTTGIGGVVTAGGGLLLGESVRDVLDGDGSPRDRAPPEAVTDRG